MATSVIESTLNKGGEFIVKDTDASSVFIPEEKNEEQKMIEEMVDSFVVNEVWPVIDRLEKLEEGLAPSLMEKMGELGLLGTHMPEIYGGMNLDFITNTIIGERIGPSGSFSVSYNAHTGIGMLPILYFGTEEQKNKYLPNLASGEWKASYCLTEPSSGSDALAAKSKAVLNKEGTHYILNGQKMWISNAGFADVFTVFAKVDGEHFTGFILEKGMEGLTLGAEERKLGIKGSSTRQVFMENVMVPIENVLGEIGKGHLIAFNVLNTGRFKLGASCLGGCKQVTSISIQYANERVQFKSPISAFGAIQSKIADQSIQTFVTECATYRIADLISKKIEMLKEGGMNAAQAKLEAAEEYAIECSILKIQGSEALDIVVDEGVQIHGGMGYSEEGTIARAYRDSRINRIFEGTNEINKMVIMNTIFKKAMKGELDIATPAMTVQQQLMEGKLPTVEDKGDYNNDYQTIANFKRLLHIILGSVGQQAMSDKLNLREEQELLMTMADMVVDIFNAESTLLRIDKMSKFTTKQEIDVYNAILRSYLYDANARMQKSAMDALGIFVTEDLIPMYMRGIKTLTKFPIQNIKALKRKIASPQIEANEYSL
jgi:alkylation response protein AidB-like acyl-CoA dehydrogenase